MKYIVRITATGQFVRIAQDGKVVFTSHMGEATRFEDRPSADTVKNALPYSIGARRMEVKR